MLRVQSESTPEDIPQRSLDLAHLSKQTLGNRDLEREVLALFRRQARQVLFQLDALTDPQGRFELAHALNGSAKGIGAWRVAAAAQRLELAARDRMPSGEAVAELAESVFDVIGEIDDLLVDA